MIMEFLRTFCPNSPWIFSGLLATGGVTIRIFVLAIAHAEYGYEDDFGFHFDHAEASRRT